MASGKKETPLFCAAVTGFAGAPVPWASNMYILPKSRRRRIAGRITMWMS